MPKFNILHVCDKFGANGSTTHGASRLFEWWIPRFNKEKYNITVCGLKPEDKASQRLRALGLDVICIKGKNKYDPTILLKLLSLVRKKKIQLLHVHGFGATNFGRIVSLLTHTPLIIHEHAYLPKVPGFQIAIDKILSPVLYKAIAVSDSVRSFLIDIRKINPSKITIIYNGAPLETFKPAPSEILQEERKRWNIPEDHIVIGMIGRLHIQKGHEYFFQAARLILEKHPNTTFMIVGDGMLWEDLQIQCQELGISGSVIFTGHQENIAKINSIFDIQVFPSLWEGTPLTLFEAMAIGKPIVASCVDGLQEVLEHNKTGLLVLPKDYQKLADSTAELINDKDKRNLLSTNARNESNKYDIKKTVRQIESVYDELFSKYKKKLI